MQQRPVLVRGLNSAQQTIVTGTHIRNLVFFYLYLTCATFPFPHL